LPNFIKREHPKKGKKKNQKAKSKVHTTKQHPKKACHMEVMEPLKTFLPQNCKQLLYVKIE
jgi:hypothetical protein